MNKLNRFLGNKYTSATIIALNVLLFLVTNDERARALSLLCICSVIAGQILRSIHKDNDK